MFFRSGKLHEEISFHKSSRASADLASLNRQTDIEASESEGVNKFLHAISLFFSIKNNCFYYI